MSAPLLAKLFTDEQLVLADGEHPEEVEDEEVRASRLAMPLLQWLADQHHRKHVPGTTTAASSTVPAYGGDAGAVSRLVASALVRDWSALSLPALAALVRVLTTECASFLPAHAAEEVARRTVEVARRHVGSGGDNGRGGLLVDILECLLRLAEQNGAPLLIHSARTFFALLVDEGSQGKCAVGPAFECVRMGLRASPVLRQMTSQLFSEHLLPAYGGATSGEAASDVFLLLAMGCTQERTGEANRMLSRLLLGQVLPTRTGPAAAAPLVERVVEAAVRAGGDGSSDELAGLLRGLAFHLVNGDSWRRSATTTKGEPALQWSDSLAAGGDEDDEEEDDGGDEGDVGHDPDDDDDGDAAQAGTDQAETQIELGKLILIAARTQPLHSTLKPSSHRVFGRHEASRGAVFEAVLGRATDASQTRDAQAACTSVLATLALRHPEALLALLTRTMPHWPEYCAQLPSDVSHRILGAFLPLGRYDAAFSHHLLKFITAAMLPGEQNDNAAASRRFAVHGLCTLLSSSSSSSSPSSASAAVASLACISVDGGGGDYDERRPSLVEHALGLPLDSRKPFYDSLHAMFLDYAYPRGDDGDNDGDDDGGYNITAEGAMGRVMLSGRLHGLLLERAGRHFYCAEPPGPACPRVALLSCFEPTPDPPTTRPSASAAADSAAAASVSMSASTSTSTGFSLHVRLRELLPELLRCLACCASLLPDHSHPNYQRTRELFGALVAQMVDTSASATSAYTALAGVPAPSAGADQLTDHTSPGARRRASPLPPTIWAARASASSSAGGGTRRVQLRSLNGAGELALCPPSLISLRQRMVVLAPLYEAIIDCVLRCPQLFEGLGPGGANRKAVELLEVRSTLLGLTRTAVKKNRRTHYATILHTDGHRPRAGKPLLSMEGLLGLLDLHRASACVLSTEAVKDLLALIGRHVALRKSSANLDPRGSWDAGALFSRLFGFYHSTLTDRDPRPAPSSSGLARSLERKGRDDVLRLRKALVRLMGAMLSHKPARHPASAAEAGHDHDHDEAVFAASVHRAIHAAVQLFLPRITRTAHDAAPDDGDGAGADREQQRKRPRMAGDDADSSAEPCAAVTPTEACAALACFFADQARREVEAGAEKVVPEYVRAVAALSAMALEPGPLAGDRRPVLECAERHEWDRRRRRCVPWLARAVRVMWAMVMGRRWAGGTAGSCGEAAWAVGRAMVRHVLAYGFLLPLDDRRRFAHDLFDACSDALEARKERLRAGSEDWSAGVPQPQPLEQQQRERGFGEAGLLELLAHHRHQATQALALLRARRHLLPPSGVLGALRLVTASQGEFVRRIEWLPSEVLQRFLALTSKVCKVCAELAGQLYRVELARAENAKNAVQKHVKSPFFHPEHKPSPSPSSSSSSSSSSASFLKRRVGYYDYGIARPKADDGGDPEAVTQRPQLEWTPAAREQVERLLVECAALMGQTRRWVVGDRRHEGLVAGTGAGVSGALGSFASAVDLYCGALRRLARLPAWRESPTGKELAVGLAELEEKEEADEGEDDDGEGEERKKKRRRKRAPRLAVMRSTNSYIDAELRRAGGGNDSYADLEDFIECPKGPIVWD